MDNKLTSLILKVGMAIILGIGVVLIWVNLSYGSGDDEITSDQAFYVNAQVIGPEDTLKTIEYDYVLDYENDMVINLTNGELYELKQFKDSKTEIKELKILDPKALEGKESVMDIVDPVLMDEFNLINATTTSVTYTMWLMYGGLILIALFSIFNIAQNPKRFIRSAIGFVLLIIITFVCYSIAADSAIAGAEIDSIYKMTGMGIGTFIALSIIAIALILIGSIVGALRYFSK